MFFAGHMGGVFKARAEKAVDSFFLGDAEGDSMCAKKFGSDRFDDETWKIDVRQALVSLLVEEYVACRFRVEPVLPRKFPALEKYMSNQAAIFPYGLDKFYALYFEIRALLDDDFDARSCEMFNFNDGLLWSITE